MTFDPRVIKALLSSEPLGGIQLEHASYKLLGIVPYSSPIVLIE
jgi:hypothetical protein